MSKSSPEFCIQGRICFALISIHLFTTADCSGLPCLKHRSKVEFVSIGMESGFHATLLCVAPCACLRVSFSLLT